LGVQLPEMPGELDAYLESDDASEPNTRKLLEAITEPKPEARFKLIEAALTEKPNALVIIDPLELLFGIDTGKKQHVLWLYKALRHRILAKFPHAAILNTFNLRKFGKGDMRPSLLTNPREWLEEVCGTLDILNRSDVRLGMDTHDDDVKVINGIRRGEEMQPLLIRPVSCIDVVTKRDALAGFELCPLDGKHLAAVLTAKQLEYWNNLPTSFRFEDFADKGVPRGSLSRLLARAQSLGLVRYESGWWRKKLCKGWNL